MIMGSCSNLQQKGIDYLSTIETENIICKEQSDDILIVTPVNGWTQEAQKEVEGKDTLEMVTSNPIGNKQVVIRVKESDPVYISRKQQMEY